MIRKYIMIGGRIAYKKTAMCLQSVFHGGFAHDTACDR